MTLNSYRNNFSSKGLFQLDKNLLLVDLHLIQQKRDGIEAHDSHEISTKNNLLIAMNMKTELIIKILMMRK